jgi:hypothetical protein
VGVGVHVEVELIDEAGNVEPLAFVLVNENAADFEQGFLGVDTPLGKAIRGKFAGSVIPYQMGDIARVRIVCVQPARARPADAAARRQAVLQKALSDAERTNAEMFASSYSGKWGDYNMDSDEQEDA